MRCTNIEAAAARPLIEGDASTTISLLKARGCWVRTDSRHCAVCHGNDLKGGGSVPSPYRVPPDLTMLARRHGGKFPDAYVSKVLRNGVVMPAHGPPEMPIWGPDFRRQGADSAEVTRRIANLTNYIKSHQAK